MTGSYWYPLSTSSFGEDEVQAATRVLRSGWTTMGSEVAHFEEAFAGTVDARHAVMVNSGSSADLLIAYALVGEGILEPGDEVLVPAVTWPTQVWAWVMAGMNVRLVDVDPASLNTTVDILDMAIRPETKAISLVHLMGVPCDMGPIIELAEHHGLVVTEDCCEALGAAYGGQPVGSFGVAASWSMFFSHQMSTMEGGMITTHDDELADRLRGLRSHGWTRHKSTDRYTFDDWGFNVRPTEVAAAIGTVQLDHLPRMNRARTTNRAKFMGLVKDVGVVAPTVPLMASPSWFGLPLMTTGSCSRDILCERLEINGVECRPILGGNLARQPVAGLGHFKHGYLPGADLVHERGFFLGLHPDTGIGYETDIDRLASLMTRVKTAA